MNSVKSWLPFALPLVILGLAASSSLATVVTDGLWYSAIGYGSVFQTLLFARVGTGVAFAVLTFVVLFGHVDRALSMRKEPGPKLGRELPDNPLARWLESVSPRRVALVSASLVALLIGSGASEWWQAVLLFWHGGSFGWVDPVLGRDAGFYVFTLPLLQLVRDTLSLVWFLSLVVSVALYVARGGIFADVTEYNGQVYWRALHVRDEVKTHLAVLLVGLGLLWAGDALLDRYALMYAQEGLIAGPGYTAVTTVLPLKLVEALVWVATGVLGALAVRRLDPRLASGAVVLAVVAWLVVALLPGSVQRFMVLPNELAYETEHITSHISATRFAFGLDAVDERALPGDDTIVRADIDANRPTVDNVRLWDHRPLLDTFGQVQEIRTYYEFFEVDNDRYRINGDLRQVMMSPRELQPSALPDRARTWVNERMVYTHGYGVALGPVNEVTEQGLPRLWVKDLPPKVLYPDDLRIDRPEIYFGERTNQSVFVNTNTEEFDYPTGDDNVYTQYQGAGGAPIGSTFTRAMFAWREGDFKLLLTTDLTADSRVLLHRQIESRVAHVAPWVAWDADPYLVITEGRLVWVLDGYTASRRFPYSVRAANGVNYMRNAVKATVDAYDGTVTVYAMEPNDPILQAWDRAFPDVLADAATIPEDLRAHLRFPQDYFSVQTELFATYHMTEPQVFYNREDEWAVPEVNGTRMTPYYTVMKLPGESVEEYVVLLPFVPREKQNLAAWMVGRNDGEHYGQLLAWKFPKDKLIYGPEMVVGRINQDDLISEKLSLWSQKGSKAILGTLLVIPVEESLVYVQPLYLQAESGSIPELKRVIVAYKDDIAMQNTLDGALDNIFGKAAAELGEPVAIEGTTVAMPSNVLTAGVNASTSALVAEAVSRYQAAVAAQREGDWATYGSELAQLGSVLERLDAEEAATGDELGTVDDAGSTEATPTPGVAE